MLRTTKHKERNSLSIVKGQLLNVSNAGFALLMAIMVGSLFLAIGATIYRIALIQIILSSTGKESQFAFYAADTGLECALYWNYHYTPSGHDGSGSAFSIGLGNGTTDGDPNSSVDYDFSNRQRILGGSLWEIQCLGDVGSPMNITRITNFKNQGSLGQTVFDLNSNGICATVEISKKIVLIVGQPTLVTEIVSHGYNTCASSDRKVERAIKATLQ